MAERRKSGRVSAGILLYRFRDGSLEVLLGHPGGPFFANKRDGHWSIPKGEPDPSEDGDDLRGVALREFEEETGHAVERAGDDLVPLGEIIQEGGKRVVAWAAEGDLDPATARSNLISMEWPPRSGQHIEFGEIDEVAWLAPDQARERIKDTQVPFIDRLEELLSTAAVGADD
jgi:predicted NUDIX family NTP pyrophosphohydrolase